MTQTTVYILIVINVITFLVYGIDKWKAKQGSWRISEATLLLLAVIGGSIGALLGMNNPHAWFGERVSKPLFSFIVVLSYN